jgi:hypothetical protein
MAFSNLKLSQVKEKYGLIEVEKDLFPNLQAIQPSAWLNETLNMSIKMPLLSEKAKSEFIISPILMEVWRNAEEQFSIYSGVTLDVEVDLKGECDFILSHSPKSIDIQTPIFTLIEGKDDNVRNGIGQCAVQMYAAQKFNEIHGKVIPVIYGCVTTGDDWQFLKLEKKILTFHDKRLYFIEVDRILGVFDIIVKGLFKK